LIRTWEPQQDIFCLYVRWWARQLRRHNFNLDSVATLFCLSNQSEKVQSQQWDKVGSCRCHLMVLLTCVIESWWHRDENSCIDERWLHILVLLLVLCWTVVDDLWCQVVVVVRGQVVGNGCIDELCLHATCTCVVVPCCLTCSGGVSSVSSAKCQYDYY